MIEVIKKQFIENITKGVSLPKDALSNEKTIDFYFESLCVFINDSGKDYDFSAELIENRTIILFLEESEFLKFTFNAETKRMVIETYTLDFEELSPEEIVIEAKNISNILNGLMVYNESWASEEEEAVVDFKYEGYLKSEADEIKIDTKKYNSEFWKKNDQLKALSAIDLKDYKKFFKK